MNVQLPLFCVHITLVNNQLHTSIRNMYCIRPITDVWSDNLPTFTWLADGHLGPTGLLTSGKLQCYYYYIHIQYTVWHYSTSNDSNPCCEKKTTLFAGEESEKCKCVCSFPFLLSHITSWSIEPSTSTVLLNWRWWLFLVIHFLYSACLKCISSVQLLFLLSKVQSSDSIPHHKTASFTSICRTLTQLVNMHLVSRWP